MSNPLPTVAEVRERIAGAFGLLGLHSAEVDGMRETFLLDGGLYRGRSFRAGGLMALWLMETSFVTIYDQTGEIALTLDLQQPAPATLPMPAAAEPAAKQNRAA